MTEMTLTIQQLYDRVWTEPVHRIAKEFGLSDRGLGKFCARHRIPVPGRGYWRRVETGQKPRRLPLAAAMDPTARLYIGRDEPAAPPPQRPPDEHPLIAFEHDPANRITVPDTVRLTHPLIRSTKAFWATPPGVRWEDHPFALNITVSKPQRTRALRIMQTLLTALETRGMRVAITKERKTVVTVLGCLQEIRLTERQKQQRRVLTDAQRARGWPGEGFDLVATGELVLRIERAYWSRSTWKDRKERKIEDCLNQFAEGLVQSAIIDAKHAEERAARERDAAERARRIREEEEKIRQLDDWMKRWRRAEEVRAFLDAARHAHGSVDPTSDAQVWFSWVGKYADELDPLPKNHKASY